MLAPFLAILAVASCVPPQAELRCPSEVLVCASGPQQHAMTPDGRVSQLAEPPPSGTRASDGTIATVTVEGAGVDSRVVILVTPPPGTTAPARRVDVGQGRPTHLQWTAKRTLLYEAAADGAFGIFELDPGAESPSPRRLSPPGSNCRTPALSPSGAIAWTVERRREGKAVHEDVVIVEPYAPQKGGAEQGLQRRRLLEGSNIGALEFSRDGTKLAIGAINDLRVIDVATGEELKRWELVSLDQRLYAHAPTEIRWSHDGETLAFTASFVGGVSYPSGEKPPVLFGDREVFVLGSDGKLNVATLPAGATDRPTSLRWQAAGG